jgi:hypothetical protein
MTTFKISLNFEFEITDELAVREAAFHSRVAQPDQPGSAGMTNAQLADVMSDRLDAAVSQHLFVYLLPAVKTMVDDTPGFGPNFSLNTGDSEISE